MAATVRLSLIVEMIMRKSEGLRIYLNSRTGEVISIPDQGGESASQHEGGASIAPPSSRQAADIAGSKDHLELPRKSEKHERDIMQQFCDSLMDEDLREELLTALEDSTTKGLFKAVVKQYDLEDAWNEFHEQFYYSLAADWCDQNGIPYLE